jgi:sugar transferase (PEP-CTERM/EpsH1 system associated)
MRILWLKTELLHPVDKGGKIRTYFMLRELKREHHVTYLSLDDGTAAPDAAERASEYCDELIRVPFRTRAKFSAGFYRELLANAASPLPYFIAKYRSTEMRAAIERCVAGGDFDVVVCDFLNPSVNLPERLPCATVLFQHNVEAMIWRRHYETQTNPLKRAYLRSQWRRAVAYEREACRRFDLVVAVSPEDRDVMREQYGVEAVADVPTGVDTEFFRPAGVEETVPDSLVFTGSMDWLPNEDAIRYFTEEILPLVREAVPGVTLTVVGRNPFPGLLELSRRDPAVVVTGRVEDVRPYMERAAAYVIPLRVGGGTRLKVYEAMAMEKPIVSTSIGVEGLPMRDGVEYLCADSPERFAEAVIRLLRDPCLARSTGRNAAETVRARFGWAGVAEEFARLCREAGTSHRDGRVRPAADDDRPFGRAEIKQSELTRSGSWTCACSDWGTSAACLRRASRRRGIAWSAST